MLTDFRLVQPSKTRSSTYFTVFGISIDSKLVHPQNKSWLRVSNEAGMTIDVNDEQHKKAASPILVMEDGSVTDFNPRQYEKASFPIEVML